VTREKNINSSGKYLMETALTVSRQKVIQGIGESVGWVGTAPT
jgi:hypothetical protein